MSPGDGTGLADVLDRADTLLASAVHARWTLTDGRTEIRDTVTVPMSCAGARCVDGDGTAVTTADLRRAYAGSGATGAVTGTRGGFGTVTAESAFTVTQRVDGATVTARPEATGWGAWGGHGFALLVLGAGPVTARAGGDALTGEFSSSAAYALGDASGSNPTGFGRATWRGVAEAASTATFQRLAGTATVTIANLSRPLADVAIDVPGHDIGAPGWSGIPISGGRFSTGTAGRDHLAGSFHGPGHEEAWGVFDTATHVGAFGAKRAP